MKKLAVIVTVFCLLAACQQSTKQIPLLPLPLVLRCGFNGPYIVKPEDDYSPIIGAIPTGWHLAGRIPTKGNIIAALYFVVGDLQYPFVITYNEDARRIDSLSLQIGDCFDQPMALDRTVAEITSTGVFELTDSMFVKSELADSLNGGYCLSVKRRHFGLGADGRFTLLVDTSFAVRHAVPTD